MTETTLSRLTCTTHRAVKDFPHTDPEWAEKHDAFIDQHEADHLEDADPCVWESVEVGGRG